MSCNRCYGRGWHGTYDPVRDTAVATYCSCPMGVELREAERPLPVLRQPDGEARGALVELGKVLLRDRFRDQARCWLTRVVH